MKRVFGVGGCVGLVLSLFAEEAKPVAAKAAAEGTKPAAVEAAKPAGGLDWDGGGDLRVRQEVLGNMPQRGGARQKTQNYIRFRPRAWGAVKNEDFKLYVRVADEMREYNTPHSPNYRWPDELYLDNLYLDLYNLFDDRVDLRLGRQDFFGPNGPVYGAGRVIADGTPGDGSRSIYMDAARAIVKIDPKSTLDVLAIYNNAEDPLSVGRSYPYGYHNRPLNDYGRTYGGMDQWGGGLYYRNKHMAECPFELYYLFMRETKARFDAATTRSGRSINTFGTRVMPKITETLSAEFEGAAQVGEKDNGPATSGYMGYAGLTYKPEVATQAKPYLTGACYYLSGDKNRGAEDDDSSWHPLWAQWPQFSELYVYNTIDGSRPGYWTNLVYPHVDAGVDLGPGHKVSSSLGPLYAATEDGLGGGDGNERGWLGMVRYDFPLWKNIFGLVSKRGELYGHVTAEVLDPGDYYTSDQWAYFLRWEVNAKF